MTSALEFSHTFLFSPLQILLVSANNDVDGEDDKDEDEDDYGYGYRMVMIVYDAAIPLLSREFKCESMSKGRLIVVQYFKQ